MKLKLKQIVTKDQEYESNNQPISPPFPSHWEWIHCKFSGVKFSSQASTSISSFQILDILLGNFEKGKVNRVSSSIRFVLKMQICSKVMDTLANSLRIIWILHRFVNDFICRKHYIKAKTKTKKSDLHPADLRQVECPSTYTHRPWTSTNDLI